MLKFKRRLYHRCSTAYKDGTRMLIGKGQDCVLSTNYPFWKIPEDIDSKVETRSMLKRKKLASLKYILDYENSRKIINATIKTTLKHW